MERALREGASDPVIRGLSIVVLESVVEESFVSRRTFILHPNEHVEVSFCVGFLDVEIEYVNTTGTTLVTVDGCKLLLENVGNTTSVIDVGVRYYVSAHSVLKDSVKTYAVMRWVAKNIKYVDDGGMGDYVRSPRETLRMGGDCEDIAILASSMLLNLGVKAGVAVLRVPGKPVFHAVSVVCPSYELEWFIAELATLYSWRGSLRYVELPSSCILLDPQVRWSPWSISFERDNVVLTVFVESTIS